MDVVRQLLNESCYYKLLDVEFDATYEDIRRKYRERALAFHPDKRPLEEKEECKNLFQKIQQAYECLSNDETRRWYDKNRHLILKSQRQHDTDDFDIWYYFGSCYSGYDESKRNNFFEVYRRCFAKIAELEMRELQYEPELELDEFPEFGTSQTDWKEVNKFYLFWQNFATIRAFMCNDMWQVEGRMHRRYFERKVKKEHSKLKKEFNESVRNLANMVKNMDPRVMRYKQEQEELKAQMKLESVKLKEKLDEIKHVVKSEIINNMRQHIDEIERQKEILQQQDTSRVFASNYDDEMPQTEEQFFACRVCNKVFRSSNQLDNHLKSKQHQKNARGK
ncbi:dnaJ homolog subfamily C member 21 [Babesia ovata]|uniref:DnaJ homolog subfamily C member 21 n=1 Tax=Babesia ovata TaxID=189622 RepID=A0A2H6KGY9_9APIC|nr:dnaJ homolog subfamily C member 21 [Babesia ovata]GBE62270.1 dnaJ homolog subfamily C member 21 [Babesia ovata]